MQVVRLVNYACIGIITNMEQQNMKPLFWIASAKKALKAMPGDVQDTLHGIATRKPDIDIIRDRLKAAEAHAKGELK